MKLAVLDQDRAAQEYYNQILQNRFTGSEISFHQDREQLISGMENRPPDLLILGGEPDDATFFPFLEEIVRRGAPVIVISSRISERFIVECIRIGAIDYTSKRNIKHGHLPLLVERALVESSRWKKTQDFRLGQTLPEPHRTMDLRARDFLIDDLQDRNRSLLSRGITSGAELRMVEGTSQNIVYLFLYLHIPAPVTSVMDPEQLASIKNLYLDAASSIAARYGGRTWSRKDSVCFFAFVGAMEAEAGMAAIEIQAAIHVLNMTVERLSEPVQVSIGIDEGITVYRENKGDLVSEALNLTAHMAMKNPGEKRILITETIYKKLWPRLRKYFFLADPFEEQTIYRFEMIA